MWYRKWSDGWIEQGSYVSPASGTSKTISFVKKFSNTNYSLVVIQTEASTTDTEGVDFALLISNFSVSSFRVSKVSGRGERWYACGY